MFSKSFVRNRLYHCLLSNGAAEGKRLFNHITEDLLQNMPEAQIKCLLLQFLQCYDITEDERTEAIRLLQMADTALTPDQTRIITEVLSE